MKRLHATAIGLYLIACIAWLIVIEAWKVGRREWRSKHGLRRM